MKILRHHPITSYLLATYAWTWLFWIGLIFAPLSPASLVWKGLFVVGLSGPLVSSFALAYATGGKPAAGVLLGRLWIWRFSPWWYLVALALPPLTMMAAGVVAAAWLKEPVVLPLPPWQVSAVMFFWLLIRSGPVNEEFGWRGFLLPRLLERHSPFTASLIVGPIWALWHWPLWFLVGMPHGNWPFWLFGLMVIEAAFLFTWLYLRTKGSMLAAILFHGSLNTSFKFIPILPPVHPGLAPFVLWIGLLMLLAGVLMVVRRSLWFGPAVRVMPTRLEPGRTGGEIPGPANPSALKGVAGSS